MRPVVVALIAVSFISCNERGGGGGASPASSASPVPTSGGPYLLVPAEAAAYRRGRQREIALLRDALTRHTSLSPAQSFQAGATAAGLTTGAYQLLVARVDSGLRVRPVMTAADSGSPARAEWTELDSLRVELTVLRSRLDALGSGTP